MLWKAADKQAYHQLNTISIPVVAQGVPAPPELLDVIKCQCKARGKQCSTEACSCHKQHLACTPYCNCSGGYDCCNPHSVGQGTQTEEAGENIEFADPEDDEFEYDRCVVFSHCISLHYIEDGQITPIPDP